MPQVIPLHSPAEDQGEEPEPSLYEARRKIYPQRVHGTFRRIKWAVLFVTLGIYYILPFLRWDRGIYAPHQAVLVDLPTGASISSSSSSGRRRSITSPGF